MSGKITLNNGLQMPLVGLGTWKSPPDQIGMAVDYALTKCGYRHIDCAAIYRNEKEIGNTFSKIFKGGAVDRADVFITSKLWNTDHQPKDVTTACKNTLNDLKLEYLDLYLMHWGVAATPDLSDDRRPRGEKNDENGNLEISPVSIRETWQAMEELVKSGLTRAIGVANFTGPMLLDLLASANIKPAVNQIELHPYNQQTRLIEFCQHNSIAVVAYSPLGRPGNLEINEPVVIKDNIITDIAHNYGKSATQILIRWAIQRNTAVIPKSVTPTNIANNFQVFDFELSDTEMMMIAQLERGYRFVDPWSWWHIPYFN